MPSKFNAKEKRDLGEKNYRQQASNERVLPRLLTENLTKSLCICYDVPKQEIVDAFKAGARTFEAISNQTYACQGCGGCQRQLEQLIDALKKYDYVLTDAQNLAENRANNALIGVTKNEQA